MTKRLDLFSFQSLNLIMVAQPPPRWRPQEATEDPTPIDMTKQNRLTVCNAYNSPLQLAHVAVAHLQGAGAVIFANRCGFVWGVLCGDSPLSYSPY